MGFCVAPPPPPAEQFSSRPVLQRFVCVCVCVCRICNALQLSLSRICVCDRTPKLQCSQTARFKIPTFPTAPLLQTISSLFHALQAGGTSTACAYAVDICVCVCVCVCAYMCVRVPVWWAVCMCTTAGTSF